jgi:hypothetical protein
VFQVRLFTPTPKATKRVLEVFIVQLNNDKPGKVHLTATRRIAEWWAAHRIAEIARVEAFRAAAFVKEPRMN